MRPSTTGVLGGTPCQAFSFSPADAGWEKQGPPGKNGWPRVKLPHHSNSGGGGGLPSVEEKGLIPFIPGQKKKEGNPLPHMGNLVQHFSCSFLKIDPRGCMYLEFADFSCCLCQFHESSFMTSNPGLVMLGGGVSLTT